MERARLFDYSPNEIEDYHMKVLQLFDIDNIDIEQLKKQYVYYGDLYIDASFLNEGVLVDANIKCSDSLKNALRFLQDNLLLNDWQIYERCCGEVVNWNVKIAYEHTQDLFSVVIPNIKDNLEIVNDIMAKFGYFEAKHTVTIDSKNDTNWYIVTYNPISLPNLNPYLESLGDGALLLHYSPKRFEDSVKNNGLVPQGRNEFVMSYPEPRLFFKIGSANKAFNRMMKVFADKQEAKGYSREFVGYMIFVTAELLSEYEFFVDPNVPDCCFCTKTIPYSLIDKIVYKTF